MDDADHEIESERVMTAHDMREQCAKLHDDEAARLEANWEAFTGTPGLLAYLLGWHREWAEKMRKLNVSPQAPESNLNWQCREGDPTLTMED